MVNDAPVSTVASMSSARWPSMLAIRSGHLKVPIGKPRRRKSTPPPILADSEGLLQMLYSFGTLVTLSLLSLGLPSGEELGGGALRQRLRQGMAQGI